MLTFIVLWKKGKNFATKNMSHKKINFTDSRFYSVTPWGWKCKSTHWECSMKNISWFNDSTLIWWAFWVGFLKVRLFCVCVCGGGEGGREAKLPLVSQTKELYLHLYIIYDSLLKLVRIMPEAFIFKEIFIFISVPPSFCWL